MGLAAAPTPRHRDAPMTDFDEFGARAAIPCHTCCVVLQLVSLISFPDIQLQVPQPNHTQSNPKSSMLNKTNSGPT